MTTDTEKFISNSMDHPSTSTYNNQHSEFVSSQSGTNPLEILHILFSISITPLLTSLLLPWFVPSSYTPLSTSNNDFQDFISGIIEYPFIIILPIFMLTIFAGDGIDELDNHISYCIPLILILICLGLVTVNHAITQPKWSGFQNEWNKIKCKSFSGNPKKIPFVTTFRSIITYVTVISILAVDFPIFPRRFAKTKTFGFSLMDIGTGSFIFANGIVAPEAKKIKPNLRKSAKSCIPLLFLGFVRLLTIKGIEYHEVVEEYGVHWNFFFTLAAIKLLSSIIFHFVPPQKSLTLCCVVGILYEIFLVQTGFQNEYLLNPEAPRISLIDANREGLFSTLGYLSIYMASIYCGQLLYARRKSIGDWSNYCLIVGAQSGVLHLLSYVSHVYGNPCSRRAGNLSYVLWALSTNYTVYWLHLLFNLIQVSLQNFGLLHGPLLFHQLQMHQEGADVRLLKEVIDRNQKAQERRMHEEKTESTLYHLEKKMELLQNKLHAQDNDSPVNELNELSENMDEELSQLHERIINEKKYTDDEKEQKAPFAELPNLTRTPLLLEAISYNGLAVFLIGNLLTGAINSFIHTMYSSKIVSVTIIWVYGTVVTLFSVGLYTFKIQLKFW